MSCSITPTRAVRERVVPAAARRSRHHLQHEPQRQRVGQLGDGELLLEPQDRAGEPAAVPDPRGGPRRRVRLHRAVLQSQAATLNVAVPEPGGVRRGCRQSKSVSGKAGKAKYSSSTLSTPPTSLRRPSSAQQACGRARSPSSGRSPAGPSPDSRPCTDPRAAHGSLRRPVPG